MREATGTHKMTYTISYFVYLAIATGLAQGSEYEVFNKPQTEQGKTHDIQGTILAYTTVA